MSCSSISTDVSTESTDAEQDEGLSLLQDLCAVCDNLDVLLIYGK